MRNIPNNQELLKKIQAGGISKIPASNDVLLTELIKKTITDFLSKYKVQKKCIKKIYIAHSLPFLSPSTFSFFEHSFSDLGLENIPRAAISGQPCAILHFCVYLAGLQLNKLELNDSILVIGADKAFSNGERIFFNSAMGDSVFIGLITKNTKDNLILSSYIHTKVVAYQGENSDKNQIDDFRAANPSFIRMAIENALQKAKLNIQDIKYIIPHTPYTQIWDTISALMHIPIDKFLINYISETGHLNSNDSFIHYTRATNEKLINKNDIVLLINPAFGGTRGVTIIKR
ncbi:3-oxoacyl-[acyl-carrier-protein] synthase III C-terminal domain-containing protein [Bacteroides sp. 519]|uniref:3-oxoacyl-[acyl-carrier-protein] synthase III C-terminal domain-containing protein n=1 Tax=Bacteroides sp. 519 TaxID=2302937 RepID=UPI0013D6846F|nr:3-oxoacyl-[acyl-carrier-protein] synthase III C-terminal domain-containing protein [Bacteroides sp. 519]